MQPNSKRQVTFITAITELFSHGEEIFLCKHVSMKSGKTKHKPLELYVSKRNRKSSFLNGTETYPCSCNTQRVFVSVSLPPPLGVHFHDLEWPHWPQMPLNLQVLKALRPQARDEDIKQGASSGGRREKKAWSHTDPCSVIRASIQGDGRLCSLNSNDCDGNSHGQPFRSTDEAVSVTQSALHIFL